MFMLRLTAILVVVLMSGCRDFCDTGKHKHPNGAGEGTPEDTGTAQWVPLDASLEVTVELLEPEGPDADGFETVIGLLITARGTDATILDIPIDAPSSWLHARILIVRTIFNVEWEGGRIARHCV